MKTIYLVVTGEYDDYRTHIAFADRAEAEAHAAECEDHGRVEDLTVLELGDPQPQRVVDYTNYYGADLASGQVIRDDWYEQSAWDYRLSDEQPTVGVTHPYMRDRNRAQLSAHGPDREAVRIAIRRAADVLRRGRSSID